MPRAAKVRASDSQAGSKLVSRNEGDHESTLLAPLALTTTMELCMRTKAVSTCDDSMPIQGVALVFSSKYSTHLVFWPLARHAPLPIHGESAKAPDEISYNAVIRSCSSWTLSFPAPCDLNAVLRLF